MRIPEEPFIPCCTNGELTFTTKLEQLKVNYDVMFSFSFIMSINLQSPFYKLAHRQEKDDVTCLYFYIQLAW